VTTRVSSSLALPTGEGTIDLTCFSTTVFIHDMGYSAQPARCINALAPVPQSPFFATNPHKLRTGLLTLGVILSAAEEERPVKFAKPLQTFPKRLFSRKFAQRDLSTYSDRPLRVPFRMICRYLECFTRLVEIGGITLTTIYNAYPNGEARHGNPSSQVCAE
jgi:hypothetical protein